MLKGQLVLTKLYFGKVLNDAERESCVIIEVSRELILVYPAASGVMWATPARYDWRVIQKQVAVPWREVGTMEFVDRLPKFLHKRALRSRRVRRFYHSARD